MNRFRIGILGIGAVGGFIATKLATKYQDSDTVEVILIARGKSKEAILTRGIQVITPTIHITARPPLISDQPTEIGLLDALIISTKSYDLNDAIQRYQPCIKDQTLLVPLINGVNAHEVVEEACGCGTALQGFIYIIAKLAEPAVVNVLADSHSMYFGSLHGNNERIYQLQRILADAGVNAIVPDNIVTAAWEKFFFISTMATITSFLQVSIHDVASNPENRQMWRKLIGELKHVATAMQIVLPENVEQITLEKPTRLPQGATTSMSRDFLNKNRTELESLTGYVVRSANKHGVEVPVYSRMYESLLSRTDT
jgi:2-dehydropantoate 2-reductase